MKNSKIILQHLYSHHPKYLYSRCYRKILALLPPTMQKHILYIYKKDQILYFVFDHPAFVMEFNYNKKHINDVLKLAKTEILECKKLEYSQCKSYYKFTTTTKKQHTLSYQRYTEKAKGTFEIFTKNEKLKNIFMKIKKQIQKNGTPAND